MPDDGHSYKDPTYDAIEAGVEKANGLPAGIMKRIRTKGERSNADQVSEAGARTVYQITPDTRRLFLKKYGVDAYANKEAAAQVAALHLRESFQRGGDYDQAVREYHGGTNPKNWGPKTEAYVDRAGTGSGARPRVDPMGPIPDVPHLEGMDINTVLNMNPADLGDTRATVAPMRPLPPKPAKPHVDTLAERTQDKLLGPGGIPLLSPTARAPDWSTEDHQIADNTAQAKKDAAVTTYDVVGAAIRQNWLLGKLGESFDAQNTGKVDPTWASQYNQNWAELEKPAQSAKEVQQLRDTTSAADYQYTLKTIEADRKDVATINAMDHPTAVNIVAGLLDPAGYVIGAGLGKVAEVGGIGSRALWAANRPAAAVTSLATESAVGNTLFTALNDKHATAEELATSALTGMTIGLAISPLALRSGKTPSRVADMADDAVAQQHEFLSKAADALGPDATPDAIRAEASRASAAHKVEWLKTSLADIPDDLKLLSEDKSKLLTDDAPLLQSVTERHNLEAISDNAERGLVAEHIARAEEILRANPIDPGALKTVLKLGGMESTGVRLLASESPVARAVGLTLLEGTTGAGGRRRTAAMSQATRERIYNEQFAGYDSLYHQFRKDRGAGLMSEAYTGKVRREFNERVYAEVEARGGTPEGVTFDHHPAVTRAADMYERGMNLMREEQQHVDSVGSARLGMSSRGYVQHQMDTREILRLTQGQQRKVRSVLAEQFVDEANGFDAKFSKQLAVKYLEKAMDRARGGYDVPMNLHSPEAADIVRDSLEAMNLGSADIEKLMGKFSRGGASHTKKRLRLDMSADIGEGMRLQDLFNTDVSGLYRSYARRVSGEVALAQYGVMGKKGLNVLRKAISSSNGSMKDLESFDQISAEFLNTPYGTANHKFMDNIRVATSLSRLGGMGFTQIGEFANGLAAVGVHRTFAAIGELPRLVKEVRGIKAGREGTSPILQSIDTLGGHIGLDDYTLTRLFDVKDNDIQLYGTENIGFATRAIRAGGNLQAMLSGHRMITAAQTRGMAEQIIHKAIAFVKSGKDDIALNDMGITPDIREALRKDLDQIATFKGDKLVTLDLSKATMSGHQLMTLRDAVERGASQIIQRTYTGETGKWAHDGMLKLLTQFRTFSLISVEKQWGRNQANYGALKSAMYLAGSMSFAVPIHMARVQARMAGMSEADRKKYADQNMTAGAFGRATLNYASASGLLGDVLDVGGGFASTLGGDVGDGMATSIGVRGQGQGQLVGGVIAPGVGMVQDLWQAAHGDGKKLVRAIPGSNLPYVVPLANYISAD